MAEKKAPRIAEPCIPDCPCFCRYRHALRVVEGTDELVRWMDGICVAHKDRRGKDKPAGVRVGAEYDLGGDGS